MRNGQARKTRRGVVFFVGSQAVKREYAELPEQRLPSLELFSFWVDTAVATGGPAVLGGAQKITVAGQYRLSLVRELNCGPAEIETAETVIEKD